MNVTRRVKIKQVCAACFATLAGKNSGSMCSSCVRLYKQNQNGIAQ